MLFATNDSLEFFHKHWVISLILYFEIVPLLFFFRLLD